ncbi:hypothetical protein PGSY75_0707500 [Plasmodium gaboni]|uniref:Uncharacterized protein n=1 Tax=Plasmodium gaboni TaxID=647221 RepID=A0A151LQ46_9APIC|nr:hypothetical protein PGSY75_0707500 [Plasmodium gaboni]KYO01237.1 hypothetical protein PGSY75_0707500 [Plasmodium gaboni]
MNDALEIIGEGNKMIVLRTNDKYDIDDNNKKNDNYLNNLRLLNNEFSFLNNGNVKIDNMVISYSYFYILKHIHLYSYIFIKRSVLKIVKKNDMKVLNITLQNNWIKKISYKKFKIFNKSYLADNNFVIFNNEFVDLIRNTIDFYYFNKNKKKLCTHKIKTYIQHADKLITHIIDYTDKVINYLNDNSDKIIEQITFNIKTFLRYITKKKNIRSIKKYILKYLKSFNYKDIEKYVIIYFYDYLKILKQNKNKNYNKMYRNHEKYMFSDIYNNNNNNNNNKNNDDDILYDNIYQQQQINVGYVEENLFSVPYFLLPKYKHTENIQPQTKSLDSNINFDTTRNIQYSDNLSNPASFYNDNNSISNQSYIDYTSAQNVHNDMINNNMCYNNIKSNFKYISVEIKLKCGLTDYQNMYDRYNIQQLIKIKNKNTEHLSLYVPSNFFNLDFWDIFCNLNYIFLFNSNNINMYINNKKHINTSLCSFKYFNNFFFNYSLYFPTNDSINFYFNYLNQYKKGTSRNKKKQHDKNCYDENFHNYFINEYKTRMNTYINDYFEGGSQFNNSTNNMNENFNYLTFMNRSGEMEEKKRKKKKNYKNKDINNNNNNNNKIDTEMDNINSNSSNSNSSNSSSRSSSNNNNDDDNYYYNVYYNNNCSDNSFLRASQMNNLVNKNNIVLHNNLQKHSAWKYKRNHYNIINYCQRTCIIPESINYAYKNYIFSNYFYLKYIICGTNYDIKQMLLCIKNGEYRYCFNKLLYILDIYKNMYYVHMKTFCKNAIQKLRKQYDELMNEYYIPEKLRFNSRKDNIYWNNELFNIKYYYDKGKYGSNNHIAMDTSFSRHEYSMRKRCIFKNNKLFNLIFTEMMDFKYNNKFQRIISEYLNEYINVNGLKGQFIKFKKYYNTLYYDVYKKLKNQFEKKYYTLLRGEFKIRKDFFKKLQENFKQKVLYKLNKELFYLYDQKLKSNYYFNYMMTNKLNMSVRTYFCNCQYFISDILKKVIITYREKGYEEQVNYHLFCLIDIMNYIYMKNKNKWTNRFMLLNNSFNNKEQSKNMIELIQNIMYHNSKLTKKNPFEINQNYNENLVILSCIIRKEKYLFYKLLYFQCFSSGQVQLISVMLYFIKLFEYLFNFRKEENDDLIKYDHDINRLKYEEINEGDDNIFANFKYYNKSLENIFNITENIYIKNHKNLLHFINTQKIKRLSEYVFTSTGKSSTYEKKIIKNNRNKKKNIKYDAFIYLQNCHFILGNELLMDAIQICNKATNNNYNYLKTEMKVNTRNVYYSIYEKNHPSLKKKRFTTYTNQSYIKSKYRTRQKFIEDILSKETLITTDHFHYLSSSHFMNHLNSKNICLLKEKTKPVNIHKAMLVYKNMIYFVCRFLISKTFCDNSTIFNIYVNHDNTMQDINTLQYLKNNRFKLLTINKNINSSKNHANLLIQHEYYNNSTNSQDENIEEYDQFNHSENNTIHSSNNIDSYNNMNNDTIKRRNKMNKKIYISRSKGSSKQYPLIRKIDLKRKKLQYTNQMNKDFKNLITSTYITQQNKQIFYRISLIDLSIKSLKKMDYWKNQMDNIISIYNKFCTN